VEPRKPAKEVTVYWVVCEDAKPREARNRRRKVMGLCPEKVAYIG